MSWLISFEGSGTAKDPLHGKSSKRVQRPSMGKNQYQGSFSTTSPPQSSKQDQQKLFTSTFFEVAWIFGLVLPIPPPPYKILPEFIVVHPSLQYWWQNLRYHFWSQVCLYSRLSHVLSPWLIPWLGLSHSVSWPPCLALPPTTCDLEGVFHIYECVCNMLHV